MRDRGSGRQGLEIRFARIDDERLAALAPVHWREKAAKMRFEREQRQELVAGGLLAEMAHLPYSARPRAEAPSGKPCFPDRPNLHFSLSHSDEVVMCVLSDRPVGCDVERNVPLDGDLKREIGSIEDWVCREAVFKCGESAAQAQLVEAPAGYRAAVAFCGGF